VKWTNYNKAQVVEKDKLMQLLADLCNSIGEEPYNFGRPRLPLSDMVFTCVFKVYSMYSERRFMSDLRYVHEKGYVNRVPHYNSISNYMNKIELTNILIRLITKSSLPLVSIEDKFAVDSSGFSTSVYDQWFSEKYCQRTRYHKKRKPWVKCHIMCGVKTNIITSVKVETANRHDSKRFVELLNKTSSNFDISEVSADKAYISSSIFEAVDKIGAKAFIPFKKNNVMNEKSPRLWKEMFLWFKMNEEDFMKHYHLRSNVESTFYMLKSKFGASVKSKNVIGQINEILCKILCHNICIVIREMYNLGMWTETVYAS